jgi:hypothetical protein
MVGATKANRGYAPYEMLADAGYWSGANLERCERHGIDPLISLEREKHALDGASPWPADDPRSGVAPGALGALRRGLRATSS